MRIILISIIVIMSSIFLYGDSIKLNNGQVASVSFLDTNGCSISINRNGKIVNIKKDQIESITVGENTISYINYKCNQEEKGKKVELDGDLISDSDSILDVQNQMIIKKDTINTKRLPKISYNSEDIVINANTMQYINGMWINTGPTTITKRRFYVEGENGVKRIGPLGSTLSSYLTPVPPAHSKMIGYGLCHFLAPTLLIGGLTTIVATVSSQSDGKHSKLNLTGVWIGLGLSFTSFIPYAISKHLPEKAVDIYNSNLTNPKYTNNERVKTRTQKK